MERLLAARRMLYRRQNISWHSLFLRIRERPPRAQEKLDSKLVVSQTHCVTVERDGVRRSSAAL